MGDSSSPQRECEAGFQGKKEKGKRKKEKGLMQGCIK
jgi:hypothetical protein